MCLALNANSLSAYQESCNVVTLLTVILPEIFVTGGHFLQEVGDVVRGARHVGAVSR